MSCQSAACNEIAKRGERVGRSLISFQAPFRPAHATELPIDSEEKAIPRTHDARIRRGPKSITKKLIRNSRQRLGTYDGVPLVVEAAHPIRCDACFMQEDAGRFCVVAEMVPQGWVQGDWK